MNTIKKYKILDPLKVVKKSDKISFIDTPIREFKKENGYLYIALLPEPIEYLNYMYEYVVNNYKDLEIVNKFIKSNNKVDFIVKNNFLQFFNPLTFVFDSKKRVAIAVKNLEQFDYIVLTKETISFLENKKLDILIENKSVKTKIFDDLINLDTIIFKDKNLFNEIKKIWDNIKRNNFKSLQNIVQCRGVVDIISNNRISGWAFVKNKEQPVRVGLFINNKKVAETKADIFRKDLKDKNLHKSGNCGFIFNIDLLKFEILDLEIKITDYNFILSQGQKAKEYLKGIKK